MQFLRPRVAAYYMLDRRKQAMASEQVVVNKYQRWTQDEVARLTNAYYTHGRNFFELQKAMPNRTVAYIKQKLYQLESRKSASQSSISLIESNEVSLRAGANSLSAADGYSQQSFSPPDKADYHPGWGKVFAAMQ